MQPLVPCEICSRNSKGFLRYRIGRDVESVPPAPWYGAASVRVGVEGGGAVRHKDERYGG